MGYALSQPRRNLAQDAFADGILDLEDIGQTLVERSRPQRVGEAVLQRLIRTCFLQRRERQNGQGRRRCWFAGRGFRRGNVSDEPVADTGYCPDVAGLARAVLQRATQCADNARQGIVGDNPALPDRVQQFLLAHHTVVVAEQEVQRVEDPRLQRDRGAGTAQASGPGIQGERAELKQAAHRAFRRCIRE